jgi:hypothetical protein
MDEGRWGQRRAREGKLTDGRGFEGGDELGKVLELEEVPDLYTYTPSHIDRYDRARDTEGSRTSAQPSISLALLASFLIRDEER